MARVADEAERRPPPLHKRFLAKFKNRASEAFSCDDPGDWVRGALYKKGMIDKHKEESVTART